MGFFLGGGCGGICSDLWGAGGGGTSDLWGAGGGGTCRQVFVITELLHVETVVHGTTTRIRLCKVT